jgi:6-phosphogluconolactonase
MRLNLSTGALTLPMLEERYFDEVEACAQAVAVALGDDLAGALAERGQASLAVSGGRTPQAVFPLLAARTVAWDKVAITLTDERWVAVDNSDSNEKLAREYLLKGEAKAARFVGLKTPDTTPGEGLKACEGEVATVPLPLDAAYLGMGEDGHIASLFPGSDALSQESGLCAATVAPGGHLRMSLSPKALLSARHLILMFSGNEKRKIYETAKKPGRVIDLPLRLILHQNQVPLTVFIS